MATQFKQDNPGGCDCCGCIDPPTCSLTGEMAGSQLILTWTVGGAGITSAVITNEEGDIYTLTVPPNSGTITVPKDPCRQWTLTVTNDCGSSTCNYNESNCTVRYLQTTPCENCTDIDYPASLQSLPQVQLSISGVTTGFNNPSPNYYNCLAPTTTQRFFSEPATGPGGAVFLTNPNCEINAMANRTSFFNADFTLDPCTEVWLYDCRYICSSLYTGFGILPYPNIDYFEWNVLGLTYQAGGSLGQYFVTASLYSWVAFYQRPTAGTICTSVGTLFGGPPVNNQTQKILQGPANPAILYRWLSYRAKGLAFEFNAGTRKGYYYDPTLCDAECNFDIDLARCLSSGLTSSTPDVTFNQTCPNEKALNVNNATATLTVL